MKKFKQCLSRAIAHKGGGDGDHQWPCQSEAWEVASVLQTTHHALFDEKIEISGLKINSLSNFNCQSWILLLMMKIGIMY